MKGVAKKASNVSLRRNQSLPSTSELFKEVQKFSFGADKSCQKEWEWKEGLGRPLFQSFTFARSFKFSQFLDCMWCAIHCIPPLSAVLSLNERMETHGGTEREREREHSRNCLESINIGSQDFHWIAWGSLNTSSTSFTNAVFLPRLYILGLLAEQCW